jgi:glycosyltransferase involved in cell wall biosynthesis
MRIGIEAQRIYREHKHGMDFVALEIIRNLQRIDKENDYFIYVNEGPDTDCVKETENFKIRVFGGPYPIWEQFKLPSWAKRDRLDVLHCTSNTAPVSLSVPLVVTIHDIIYFETHPLKAKGYSAYQKFGNLYRRAVVKRLLKSADRILTVSKFEQKRFVEFLNMPSEAIEVVYNGVGTHFKPIEDQAFLEEKRAEYKLPQDFFLFLGNTDPKKNTRNTVVAFAQYCKQFGGEHQLVIGDLDPEVIKGFLSDAGLEAFFDRIHFTGYIQNTDLPAIINLADVFLYPSKRESFGIPVLEGMASGTPVITSNTSSMPEVAGDAAYLVNPESVDEIVTAINTLIHSQELRQRFSVKGLERAAKFSWENTARQTLAIYETLLKLNK